jgi:hypothetical protein
MKKFNNPFKMHIVQIGNQYGIRKFSFFGWVYADIRDHEYWWGQPQQIKKWCLSTSLETVTNLFEIYRDIKTPTRIS